MRETNRCPKCDHDQILHIAAVPDRGETENEIRDLHVASVVKSKGWLGETRAVVGKLTAVVCRKCGYTELYTLNPGDIPVDGKDIRVGVS